MRHRWHLLDDAKPLEHGETAAYPFIRLSKGNYRWRKSDVEMYLQRNQIDQRKVERRNDRSGFTVERRAVDRRYADRRSEL